MFQVLLADNSLICVTSSTNSRHFEIDRSHPYTHKHFRLKLCLLKCQILRFFYVCNLCMSSILNAKVLKNIISGATFRIFNFKCLSPIPYKSLSLQWSLGIRNCSTVCMVKYITNIF